MTTKFMKLWGSSIGMSKSLAFRWEWSVHAEKKYYNNTKKKWEWKPQHIIVQNRAMARFYKRSWQRTADLRNVVLKRRRVQAHWEPYNDSFSYNAKGNGNGR